MRVFRTGVAASPRKRANAATKQPSRRRTEVRGIVRSFKRVAVVVTLLFIQAVQARVVGELVC
jgi:hypothetical protein